MGPNTNLPSYDELLILVMAVVKRNFNINSRLRSMVFLVKYPVSHHVVRRLFAYYLLNVMGIRFLKKTYIEPHKISKFVLSDWWQLNYLFFMELMVCKVHFILLKLVSYPRLQKLTFPKRTGMLYFPSHFENYRHLILMKEIR